VTPSVALQLACSYLNRRERTVAEVRARLERAGIEDAEIEASLAELSDVGSLDDARYARLFVEDRRDLDGWGGERIGRVLRERGVDPELVELALAPPPDAAEGEFERALELLGRRSRLPPTEPRDRERAYAMLVRKGYEPELAGDAVRAWAATGAIGARTQD
jgi:regulatory protein